LETGFDHAAANDGQNEIADREKSPIDPHQGQGAAEDHGAANQVT